MVAASTPRFLGLSAATAAALVITVVTAFRLFYATWLPMLPDETYYLQWSRHLDASYISKGPAVAYTIWVGTHLFGPTALGVRFFAVMLSAGTAWQIFLLARRWFDDTAGLIAVLLAGVVPLFAVGAVLMTIDPLSAFFWIWAANLFSVAIGNNRVSAWLLAGFAVGSGFLAKPLNALELLAFLVFLLLNPARRGLLAQRGFWLMLATAIFCTLPMWWWNARHHWVTLFQVGNRGKLGESAHFKPGLFLDFLVSQAAVVSPLLFLALLTAAVLAGIALYKRGVVPENEGVLFLLVLFLSVFLLYAVLAFHLRCEPNWPAVSYLSLVALLAGQWRAVLRLPFPRIFMAAAFCLGWLETVALHNSSALPLSAHKDPMARTSGWPQLADEAGRLQGLTGADEILADGYKEAGVISFYLPGQPFVFAFPHNPPATQYDFWPQMATGAPHRVLWVSNDAAPSRLADRFAHIEPVEVFSVGYRGQVLRTYHFYLGTNVTP
jgi:4-amino-4-deoxy-L-arabinose transferase-like glycosyltransferase